MKFTALAAVCALQISNSVAFAPAPVHSRRSPSTSLNNDLRNLAVGAGKPKKAKKPLKKPGVANNVVQSDMKASDGITEKEVRALFELWNSALATGDSRIVADRYIKKPVLLPTVSDKPRTDFDSVKDYFDAFLKKKPQGKILTGDIHIGDGWASVRLSHSMPSLYNVGKRSIDNVNINTH